MATKIIKAQITQRRDTLANWASVNPVLLPGELGFVTDDVNRYKIGDGVHAWNDLPFRGFDGALAQGLGDSTTAAISQKAVTDELKKKVDTEKLATINGLRIDEGGNIEIEGNDFDAEGNYPLLHVGTADDLAGRGESVPASFGFRASGGKSIKDGRAYIKRIKGNSVVWNQLRKDGAFKAEEKSGVSLSLDGQCVLLNGTATSNITFLATKSSIIKGHQYLIQGGKSGEANYNFFDANLVTTSGQNNTIFIAQGSGEPEMQRIYCADGITFNNYRIEPRLIDLTQMFGAGNEPTTIDEFNARVATLGVDLNAYNEGEVIHCNTESIKSVGDNAWDEEWKNGIYASFTGVYVYRANSICNANAFRILPNEEYWVNVNTEAYFFCYDEDMQFIKYLYAYKPSKILTPANAAYMNFYCSDAYGSTYNHDILISLYHSGWKAEKDDQYQPYWQDTLPLPIIRKYFPDGMKKAGSAHDEIRYNKSSGKWEYSKGKIKSVDLGSQNIAYTSGDISKFSFDLPNAKVIAPTDKANVMCPLYVGAIQAQAAGKDKVIYRASTYVGIYDSAYNSAASFKAAMQGVMLYYESNDWEWVELDAEDQNFRDYYNVADFGTEMSQSAVPSAPFSADIIYQFNAVDMIREHELEITELQSIIATMQAQLTSLINGGQ